MKIDTVLDSDKNFPNSIKDLKNRSPKQLYYSGNFDLVKDFKKNISIVGTRKASLYGQNITKALVNALSTYDCNIVSGLAWGIDSTAHRAALENDLPTIAVLGCGLENGKTSVNDRKLYEEIYSDPKHLVISEYPEDFSANTKTFPQRNRIIAALSHICIVIEAPQRSGTLITARDAIKLKRDLYAVPGDLNKTNFSGNNQLLSQGLARPIFDINAFVAGLGLKAKGSQNTVLDGLDSEALSLDELALKLKCNYQDLAKQLSLLEIQGQVKREPGMKFKLLR